MSNDEEFNEARIAQMVNAKVTTFIAEDAATRRAAAEAEAATATTSALDRLQLRELLAREPVMQTVLPASVRHVLAEAEAVFTVKDGALVPRAGRTSPGDPLKSLTVGDFLDELAKTDPNLFVDPGQPH